MRAKIKFFVQNNDDPQDADMKALGLNYTRLMILCDGGRTFSLAGWFPKPIAELLSTNWLCDEIEIPSEVIL